MINVVILEDELPARKKLKNFLEKSELSFTILREMETVSEAFPFFSSSPDIDLIFSDIELRDGTVFEIYNKMEIGAPIIFITAYDHFWMDAFETNCIGYLIKPYFFSAFEKALQKYGSLKK